MSNLYTRCKADPDGDNFIEKFKSLHPAFQEDLLLDKVSEYSLFRYIVITYDVESPYVIKYKDWAIRRRETAKQCGFPKNGNEYTMEVESIILGMNARTNKIILTYLFIQNDLLFTQYQSYQILYYKQVRDSLEKSYDNPSHYKGLKNNIDDLVTEIKSLENNIFHGEEMKQWRRALYEFASKISTDFRPEDRATKIENGEEPVDVSPYPDGYKPKEMSFIGDE